MELWQKILASSIRTPQALASLVPGVDVQALEEVTQKYPMCVNPYYLSLVQNPGDPIWNQCIPSREELESSGSTVDDPLSEEAMSPVPCLVHRYPDRVLFLATTECSMYCRFCTRKRKVGKQLRITKTMRQAAVDYIARTPQIRDVVISGGDPLMLTDSVLDELLGSIRAIPHVQIIRLGTRMPCVLPQRVTPALVSVLKKYHPLFLNTHFEHPREVTDEARKALGLLADAGIPLGNQSVILRGVNDDPELFVELNQKLLAARVRPYYVYQADLVEGTNHFRCPVETGLDILRNLRGHTSGLAVPHFVIDAPGGGGKIPVFPPETVKRTRNGVVLTNYEGNHFVYPDRKPTDNGIPKRAPAVTALAARKRAARSTLRSPSM